MMVPTPRRAPRCVGVDHRAEPGHLRVLCRTTISAPLARRVCGARDALRALSADDAAAVGLALLLVEQLRLRAEVVGALDKVVGLLAALQGVVEVALDLDDLVKVRRVLAPHDRVRER